MNTESPTQHHIRVSIFVEGERCSPDCAFVSAVPTLTRMRLVWCKLFDEKLYGDGAGLRCQRCLEATANQPDAGELPQTSG